MSERSEVPSEGQLSRRAPPEETSALSRADAVDEVLDEIAGTRRFRWMIRGATVLTIGSAVASLVSFRNGNEGAFLGVPMYLLASIGFGIWWFITERRTPRELRELDAELHRLEEGRELTQRGVARVDVDRDA